MAQEEIGELEIAEAPPPKSEKKLKVPKGTKIMLFIFLLCVIVFGVSRCIRGSSGDKASVSGVAAPDKSQASRVGFGNEEYNARIDQYSTERTAEAQAKGETFVPPMTGKPEPIREEATKATQEEASQESAKPVPIAQATSPTLVASPRDPQASQKMQQYLAQILMPKQLEKQEVILLNNPQPYVMPVAKAANTTPDMPGYYPLNAPPMLKPGDILYAINRVTLDSDAPGPAMVEVITGPYKGAKALGSFTRHEGYLTLQFEGLAMPNGTTYSIKGFAINPDTDRTAIRTSVDNHYIERYGGLIAASFLSGFGDAIKSSGSSSYSNAYGSGYSTPKLNLGEELWIAGGKVGTKLSDVFERKFDMPPTVTLLSGTDIGILVISVGRQDGHQVVGGGTPTGEVSGGAATDAAPRGNTSRLRGIN